MADDVQIEAEAPVSGGVTGIIFTKGDEEQFRSLVEYSGMWISARVDKDGFRAKVTAQARYGSRSVTVDVALDSDALTSVENALRRAAEKMQPEAIKAAQEAGMHAYMTAAARKEL